MFPKVWKQVCSSIEDLNYIKKGGKQGKEERRARKTTATLQTRHLTKMKLVEPAIFVLKTVRTTHECLLSPCRHVPFICSKHISYNWLLDFDLFSVV